MKKHYDSNIKDGNYRKKLRRIINEGSKNYNEFIDEEFEWEERTTTEKGGS